LIQFNNINEVAGAGSNKVWGYLLIFLRQKLFPGEKVSPGLIAMQGDFLKVSGRRAIVGCFLCNYAGASNHPVAGSTQNLKVLKKSYGFADYAF